MKNFVACIALILAGWMGLASGAPAQPKALSPTAQAVKNLADARANLAKIKIQLEPLKRRVSTVFEVRPDWKSAKEAVEQTKAIYDTETKNSLLKLHASAAYKEQIVRRDKAQAIVESSTKKDVPSTDENAAKLTDEDIANAQKDRIDAALSLKKMEKDALEGNSAYVVARQNYKEAQATWDGMQSQLDEAIKLDPAYPPIGQQIDSAEAAVKSAQDQLATLQKQSETPHPRSPGTPPRR